MPPVFKPATSLNVKIKICSFIGPRQRSRSGFCQRPGGELWWNSLAQTWTSHVFSHTNLEVPLSEKWRGCFSMPDGRFIWSFSFVLYILVHMMDMYTILKHSFIHACIQLYTWKVRIGREVYFKCRFALHTYRDCLMSIMMTMSNIEVPS